MQGGHALVIKRHFAAYQNIEDDAETPHVNLWSGVGSCLKELWGGKVETATKCLQMTAGCEEVAETKVDNLDIAGLADEDVLDFEIAVDDAVAMAVVECAGDLTAELAGLLLL